MLKLCRVTEVKVFFLVLVYVFNFLLFEFLTAILEKARLLSSAAFDVQDAGGGSSDGLVGSVKPPNWVEKLLMCAIFDKESLWANISNKYYILSSEKRLTWKGQK